MRFAIVEDPWGSFMVFDDETNMPAEIDGEPLYGLSREDAAAAVAEAEELAEPTPWRRSRAA